MQITVKFPPYMRALTNTDKAVITLEANAQLHTLFKVLIQQYGRQFTDLLHTSELGHTDVWASVTLDERTILVDGVETSTVELQEGAVVVLLGPVGGG